MPVTVTLVADRPAIRLSNSLTLKATVEGPAPLRVEVPAEILSDEAAPLWQIAPLGSAKLIDLPGGLQRWSQEYKLSPFAPGAAVPLSLREFSVSAGNDVTSKSVAFPTQAIHVETSITNIKADEARPITGIEELPPLTEQPGISSGVIGCAIAVGLLIISLILAFRRRTPLPELPPEEQALRELEALVPGADLAENLAVILRSYTAKRFDVPAAAMTTGELATAHPDEELEAMLVNCDRAKFAGAEWAGEHSRAAIERAKTWVRSSTPAPPSRPSPSRPSGGSPSPRT